MSGRAGQEGDGERPEWLWGSRASRSPAAAGLLLAAGLTAEYLTGAPAWLARAAYVTSTLAGLRLHRGPLAGWKICLPWP